MGKEVNDDNGEMARQMELVKGRMPEIIRAINKHEPVTFNMTEFFQVNSSKDKDSYSYEIIIRITSHCNLDCGYCFVAHDREIREEDVEYLFSCLSKMDLSVCRLVFSGGEPTIDKLFFQYLERVIRLGAASLTVQTNAVMFADKALVRRLPSGGKLIFFVGFPSADEGVYNKVTGSAKFRNAVDGISNLYKAGHELVLNVVVSSLNLKSLEKTAKLACELWPSAGMVFSQISITDESKSGFLVSYKNVIPVLHRCLSIGKKAGMYTEINLGGGCSMPACVVRQINPSARSSICVDPGVVAYNSEQVLRQFIKKDECRECAMTQFCYGYAQLHLKLFGFECIRPIRKDVLKN